MWDLGACKGINVSKNALMRASAACDSCKRAKGTRAPFPISTRTVKKRLALVCVDVIGPLEEGTGDNGEKYTLTIVDAATRKVWAIPVATKANALPAFIEWGKRVQNETGEILTVVRSDNGKEFVNRQFKEWAKELGVWWETTTPYTSQQNGVVERWNRTLQDRMRAMLVSSGLGNTFWPHAMRAAAYVLNRTPRLKEQGRIPQRDWTGQPVNLSNLRVFGCLCWPLVQSGQREGKLSERRVPAIFLGYGESVKGWLVYIPTKSTHRRGYSRDVLFDEQRRYQDVPVPRQTATLDEILDWHEEWTLVEENNGSADTAGSVGAGIRNTEASPEQVADGGRDGGTEQVAVVPASGPPE
ncbi:hypothetical protein A4X06_0g9897, partial [Tilletia controversa]